MLYEVITLPRSVAQDAERRERFEREARAVAALNHPNIVTIYSIEQAGDLHFMAMELIEGQTLSETIPEPGLKLGRFFELAIPLVITSYSIHYTKLYEHRITLRLPSDITYSAASRNSSSVADNRTGRARAIEVGLGIVDA